MLGEYSLTWVLHFALWGYFVLEVLAITPDVCRTPGCVQASEIFKKNMDPSVNPCDDFYHFACGNYVKTEKIPEDKTQVSTLTKVNDIMVKQVRGLLENAPPHHNEPRAFKMARDLYNICLREDLAENRGVGFVVDMMKSVGGWPAMEGDRWDSDRFNWVQMVYRLHDLGFSGELFELSVRQDYAKQLKYVLVVDQVTLELDREYLIQGRDHFVVKAYGDYMADIVHLFGAKHEVAVRELGDVLDFEIELAKMSLSLKEHRDILNIYNQMKVKELQKIYPVVNWVDYFDRKMNSITTIKSYESIIVAVPPYLDKLHVLLKKTDKRTIANFLIWRSVSCLLMLMTSALKERRILYLKFLNGMMEPEPRWKECISMNFGSMYLALGSMYVRHYFKPEAKNTALEIVENIRLETVKILNGVIWMGSKERLFAKLKAKALQKHVGYPNELLDDRMVEKHYEKLNITGEQLFESFLKWKKFEWSHQVAKLRQRISKHDWESHSNVASTQGYYRPTDNSLKYPAGLLQHVFFSHDRPKYMNYGAIGSLVGGEITHGFDFMGKDFDRFGNRHLWWSKKVVDAFLVKLQWIVDQADDYIVKSVSKNINGFNNQVVLAADTAGVKLSYRAYTTWAEKHQKEPRLVGFEKYTPQQMFWLSAANVWCTAYREEALRFEISTALHPPAEYRVNGPMRNQEAFATDFQCPVGTNMNPAEKRNLW